MVIQEVLDQPESDKPLLSVHKWYVLKVKGGREESVKKRIEEVIEKKKLEACFDRIVVPFENVYFNKKGKRVQKKRYLSYLFISIDLDESNPLREAVKEAISGIAGVYGFLSSSGTGKNEDPTPVDQQEIDVMLRKVLEVGSTDAVNKIFSEKDAVEIVDGPLQGTKGIVKRVLSEQKKLKVMIKIFSNLTETEVSYRQVKKIE